MKSYTKIIAVICMSSFFVPPLAVADCTKGIEGCISPNSEIKKEDIAILVAVTVLAGTVIWYLMSDKEDGNIHNYITTDLSTTNERYKFSLAPIAQGGYNGLALQFSYVF
jgi:hypothetical protein